MTDLNISCVGGCGDASKYARKHSSNFPPPPVVSPMTTLKDVLISAAEQKGLYGRLAISAFFSLVLGLKSVVETG